MNDEQIIIVNFLGCSPETWFGKKEIARRAVRRRVFEENPHWADEQLAELIAQRVIEENQNGQVRLKEGQGNRAKACALRDEGTPRLFSIESDEGSYIQVGVEVDLLAAGDQAPCADAIRLTRQVRPV